MPDVIQNFLFVVWELNFAIQVPCHGYFQEVILSGCKKYSTTTPLSKKVRSAILSLKMELTINLAQI